MRMLCGELSAVRHVGAGISSYLRSLEVHQARAPPGTALAHREAPVKPLVKPQEAAAAILKKSLRVRNVMLFPRGCGFWVILSRECTVFLKTIDCRKIAYPSRFWQWKNRFSAKIG